jgi:plasmid stabilization system protein ParE
MKIDYSKQATLDLHKIGADSRRLYGDNVAAMLEARLRKVIEQIAQMPEGAPRVEDRNGVHVLPLIRFPYKIFYRVLPDRIRILHIRHAARRPW